jgi:hypothetical protein
MKAAVPSALVTWTVTCKYEEPEKDSTPDPTKGEQGRCDWPYRVYCYEREQGEWTFNKNIRGSFAPEREYMTFEDGEHTETLSHPYAGWMDGGVLHFQTFDEATDFVDMHVRAKDDINLIDSIYDVYFKNTLREGSAEIQVAHYWFNGDTGGQIRWETDGFNRETREGLTDWTKVECA